MKRRGLPVLLTMQPDAPQLGKAVRVADSPPRLNAALAGVGPNPKVMPEATCGQVDPVISGAITYLT